MSDEHTPTLQNIAADRDWWSVDAGRHYHELAHGSAASRRSAGFRIPSANCWISPGATMPEPIGSAAARQRQMIGEAPEAPYTFISFGAISRHPFQPQ